MSVLYCATDGCATEATHYYLYDHGGVRPMCYTCSEAFEAGRANPEAVVCDIDELEGDDNARRECGRCYKLFKRDELYGDDDNHLLCLSCWYARHPNDCHKCGESFVVHNDDGSCVDDDEDGGPIDIGVDVYYRVFIEDEYLYSQEWSKDEDGEAWFLVISPQYVGPSVDVAEQVNSAALELSRQTGAYVAAYNTAKGLVGNFIVLDPGVIKSDDAAEAVRE